MSNRLKQQRLKPLLGLAGLSAGDFIKKTGLKPHGGVKDGAPYYAKAAVERALGRIADGEIESLYPVELISGGSPIHSAVLLHLMAACGKSVMKINGWTVISKTDWSEIEAGLEALASGPDNNCSAAQSGLAQTLGQYCKLWTGSPTGDDGLVVCLAGRNFVINPRLFVDACTVFPINIADYVGLGGGGAQACQSGQAAPAMMARSKSTADLGALRRPSDKIEGADKGSQHAPRKPLFWNKFFNNGESK